MSPRPASRRPETLARIVGAGLAVCAGAIAAAPAGATPSLDTLYTFRSKLYDGAGPAGSIVYLKGKVLVATPYGGSAHNLGGLAAVLPGSGGAGVFPWRDAPVWTGEVNPAASMPTDVTVISPGLDAVVMTTAGSGGLHNVGSLMQTDFPPGQLPSSFPIHDFGATSDDATFPFGPLVFHDSVNVPGTSLYSFTYVGLAAGPSSTPGVFCGSVYALTSPVTASITLPPTANAPWQTSVLHKFTAPDGADGCGPNGLVRDSAGTVFGTTASGGSGYELGTVFSLTPPAQQGGSWTFATIYTFLPDGNGADINGAHPTPGLFLGADGNLYGTTSSGTELGNGAVFRLSRPPAGQTQWKLKILYAFQGGLDGIQPSSGVWQDPAGNLFGVTYAGGSAANLNGIATPGLGTIFEVSPPHTANGAWTEQVLWRFSGPDGAYPVGRPLFFHGSGVTTLIGTTSSDSIHRGGTVFRFQP